MPHFFILYTLYRQFQKLIYLNIGWAQFSSTQKIHLCYPRYIYLYIKCIFVCLIHGNYINTVSPLVRHFSNYQQKSKSVMVLFNLLNYFQKKSFSCKRQYTKIVIKYLITLSFDKSKCNVTYLSVCPRSLCNLHI